MKKAPKKPTGELNLQIITGDSVIEIKTTFPDTKPDIEKAVVDLFVELHNRSSQPEDAIHVLYQNETNDLDFTIAQGGLTGYLELMEVLPGTKMRGGYGSISPIVDQARLVDHLIQKIYDKSGRYSAINEPIDLLLYLTHDYAQISATAENYIKSYFNIHPHAFRRIYLFVPFLTNNDGIRINLFPNTAPTVLQPKPGVVKNLSISANSNVSRGSNFTLPKKKRKKWR